MRFIYNIIKRLFKLLILLTIVLIILCIYIYLIPDIKSPVITNSRVDNIQRTHSDSFSFQLGSNWLQQNDHGLYEMYIEGGPYERGVVYGKLAKELLYAQELAFTNEIKRMIPSDSYLKFLRYIVRFMNRDLGKFVIDEYQEEIYGISQSASHEFDWIGNNYNRQLNYHAAHDIGHALANMMLVGCTSFATWDAASKDSQLIVGRNFDFYVGDEFAKKKIIAFYRPQKGIPFMSVIWGGFTGVVSGMNLKGLTVTINANKSSIPFGAATPVSLVAREILQYAATIDEAIAIARRRKMFVSESFLVSSAIDNKAVVIEKTPTDLDVYDPGIDQIMCTNHYQSESLTLQKLNLEQMKNSASVYRYQRLKELMVVNKPMTSNKAAAILRDYKGLNNTDIGLTNEKAMNQFIAHHSIIFEPKKKLVWVSTAPWQEGDYICYDLNKIFSTSKQITPLYEVDKTIPTDTLVYSNTFSRIKKYLELETKHLHHISISPSEIVAVNPTYYDAYRIAGDIYMEQSKKDSALQMYTKALIFEIATQHEKDNIEEKIKKLQ